MTRISERLAKLRSKNEHALIGYAVAGYPDRESTIDVIRAMVNGGVDIVELGIPFSDPIADGPTIQKASYKALQQGITPTEALRIAKRINDSLGVPLAIMTYCNILYKPGFDNFLKHARSNGVDGVIIPDLTFEEAGELKKCASKHSMDTIFLVSPNISEQRIKAIVNVTTGFLYLVSVFGTTGQREAFEDYTVQAIRRVKKYCKSKVPLAVGFGVSKEEHVKFMLNAGADAVIVGSAFINIIEQTGRQEMASKIESLARNLKNATR
ncbi:MAG: tryptophan synthase alpha chain [Candidatus Nitrosomirales archaeon]|jgi:tryptophan synthase alpha chain